MQTNTSTTQAMARTLAQQTGIGTGAGTRARRLSLSVALGVLLGGAALGGATIASAQNATPAATTGGAAAASGASAPVAKIATINIERVFNGLKQRSKLEAELKARQDQLQAELKKLQERVTDLEKNMEQVPQGDAKNKEMAKLLRLQVEAEVERRLAEAELERLRSSTFKLLYEKINDASRRLAQQRGFNMVLAADDELKLPSEISTENIQRVIGLRRMLWIDPQLDLTRDLITLMDNEFQAGMPGGN